MTGIEELFDKYYSLSMVSPENELLKYYILSPGGFRYNADKNVSLEFLARFRGDFPTLEDLGKNKIIMLSFKEYYSGFIASVVRNYYNALEKEIERVKTEKRN